MKKEIEMFLREINDGKLNKSQKKLADLLGVSKPSVSNWLSGKNKISDENIIKLAKVTKKSPEDIQKIFAVNSVVGDNNNINSKELELKDKEIELKNKEIELLKRELELWKMGYTMNAVKKTKEGKK